MVEEWKGISKSNLDILPPFESPAIGPSQEQLRIWANVKAVCDLFDLAYLIKSTELRRRHPTENDQWIRDETLKSIERGCQ